MVFLNRLACALSPLEKDSLFILLLFSCLKVSKELLVVE